MPAASWDIRQCPAAQHYGACQAETKDRCSLLLAGSEYLQPTNVKNAMGTNARGQQGESGRDIGLPNEARQDGQ